VPLIDASGVAALSQMIARCRRQGTKVILSGLRVQPAKILAQMGIADDGDAVRFADNFDAALKIARDG
jgi:SulP family sulfate permease